MKLVALISLIVVFFNTPGLCDKVIANDVIMVSFVRLLAHPEKYTGKRVQVMGFYRFAFEDQALYLSREDAQHSNTPHSFWVSTSLADSRAVSKFNNKYVRIQGEFHYEAGKGHGHLGMWIAELRDVKFFASPKN